MVMCSRLDLFQTGMTSTPSSVALIQGRNWALAWCAKRSPMPSEYFPRGSILLTSRLKMRYSMVVERSVPLTLTLSLGERGTRADGRVSRAHQLGELCHSSRLET